jgi:hypothetical protein
MLVNATIGSFTAPAERFDCHGRRGVVAGDVQQRCLIADPPPPWKSDAAQSRGMRRFGPRRCIELDIPLDAATCCGQPPAPRTPF